MSQSNVDQSDINNGIFSEKIRFAFKTAMPKLINNHDTTPHEFATANDHQTCDDLRQFIRNINNNHTLDHFRIYYDSQENYANSSDYLLKKEKEIKCGGYITWH